MISFVLFSQASQPSMNFYILELAYYTRHMATVLTCIENYTWYVPILRRKIMLEYMIWVQCIVEVHRERVCLIWPWVTADLISNSPSGLQVYSSQFERRTFTFSQVLSVFSQALLIMLLPFLDFWRITREFQRKSKILYPAGMYLINYFDMVQVTWFSKE